MSFCKQCGNSNDITKTPIDININVDPDIEIKVNALIDRIFNKIQITKEFINDIGIDNIINSKSFSKLTKKSKLLIHKSLNKFNKKSKKEYKTNNTKNIAYYSCTSCNYYEKIPPQTLIFRKTKQINHIKYEYNNDHITDYTLPHTTQYLCINSKCKSRTDYTKRDAVMKRVSHDSYKLKYYCTTCKSSWIISK